jgi:hypothetical protein
MQVPQMVGGHGREFDRCAKCESPPANRRVRAKLMHPHANPNRDIGQISRRIAALQIRADSPDEFGRLASGET